MNVRFILIIVVLLVRFTSSFGQGFYVISHVYDPDKRHYYVGSLTENSNNVYQKLKLEVFGGLFISDDLSTETYLIGTRSRNIINFERRGAALLMDTN